MIPLDTKPEIAAMQLQIRRSMSPEQRFRLALDVSNYCREVRKSGIKRDHPDWSEREIMIELFRRAFLPEPLPAWVR